MNPLESRLDYPFGELLPATGERVEVAPGVFWVRMPLPFQLNHINLWLLRDRIDDRDGWTLVDCGIASDEIRAAWETVFASGLDGLPILRILCTHQHPDHVGLAGWIHERFGAPLWMTVGEYAMGRLLSSNAPGADPESAVRFYRRHGIPEGPELDAIRNRNARYFPSLVPSMPRSFRRIAGDDELPIGTRRWKVIAGRGHSPEHAALYSADDGLLISGDMVLPRISTNVSVFELEPESNPVDWYLHSLRRFEACREDTLVLPSHGRPFRQLHERLKQQHDHHAERLAVVLQACRASPCSANDALPVLFGRRFDTHQTTFALGESLGHLHALWYRGDLKRTIDADGVVRFAAAAA